MKMAFFAMAAGLMVSSISLAKSGAECQQELANEASSYTSYSYLRDQSGGLPELRTCKDVTYTASNGAVTNNSVYILNDGSGLIIQDNDARSLAMKQVPGTINDVKVMAGRLIILTNERKIIVVGRNGGLFELLNGSNKSYTTVSSVKVIDGVLVMEQNNGSQPIELDESQVTYRLNEGRAYRSISF